LTALSALRAVRYIEGDAFDAYTITNTHRGEIKNPYGESKEVTFYSTAFTYRELKWLLQDAGFKVVNSYGCIAGDFRRKDLDIDDFEIMMIAQKE
jgi:hypothetical protein